MPELGVQKVPNRHTQKTEDRGGGGGRVGVLQISSDTDDRRIFLGLKFSIPGFLGVGKFGQCFSRWDFLAIQNRIEFRIENFINALEPYSLGTTPY